MQKYNAAAFYKTTIALSDVSNVIENWKEGIDDPIKPTRAQQLTSLLKEVQSSLIALGTRITVMTVDRLLDVLAGIGDGTDKMSYRDLAKAFTEIDSRLRDELSLVTAFIVETDKVKFLEPAEPLFGTEFTARFASTGLYEVDEAAKCMALGRDTAAVFHLMRCMETGIRAVAKSLSIPDPVTGSNRNWGAILKQIKAAIEQKTSSKSWKPGDREIFESAVGSLDAVRVAWRNTTMHVENKYNAEEAEHIYIAVRGFMKKLASRMDENGLPVA